MSMSYNYNAFPLKHLLAELKTRGLNPQIEIGTFGDLILSWDGPYKGQAPATQGFADAMCPESRHSVELAQVTVSRTEQGCTPYFNGQSLIAEIEAEHVTYTD